MMPTVSIVVPCYNEEKRIRTLLDALFAQTYPHDDLEIIIADGHSTDRTRDEIARFTALHPNLVVRVIDNTARSIPAALNRAIEAARGEIIVRLDAHSAPYPDYVARSVANLRGGLGQNVGGVWEIRPGAETWIGRGIAAAAAHPLGVGDALYRHATQAAAVDTVPFGCFYRHTWQEIGKFDESLLTNEDYEFNARIRLSGGRIWLDPAIRAIYFARGTLGALARQYWRYGFWKWQMLRRYPKTLRWRQALPPLFVLSLLGGAALAWLDFFRFLLLAEVSLYALVLFLAGFHAAWQRRDYSLVLGLPLSIATKHLSWGAGFLWSMFFGRMR